MADNEDRNALILALRGTFSYGYIAHLLGVSRLVVAGVCWRASNPPETRVLSPNGRGGGNKTGSGHHGPGGRAPHTVFELR